MLNPAFVTHLHSLLAVWRCVVSNSENRSRHVRRNGGETELERDHRRHRHGERDRAAGRAAKATGSTDYVKNPYADGLPEREIDAIRSSREIEFQ